MQFFFILFFLNRKTCTVSPSTGALCHTALNKLQQQSPIAQSHYSVTTIMFVALFFYLLRLLVHSSTNHFGAAKAAWFIYPHTASAGYMDFTLGIRPNIVHHSQGLKGFAEEWFRPSSVPLAGFSIKPFVLIKVSFVWFAACLDGQWVCRFRFCLFIAGCGESGADPSCLCQSVLWTGHRLHQ